MARAFTAAGVGRIRFVASAPIPPNDVERLAELRSYAVLDTPVEQGYEDVTPLASYICETPYALVTLVDHDRQFLSRSLALGRVKPTAQTVFADTPFWKPRPWVVPDSRQDERFAHNPLVTGRPAYASTRGLR